MLMELGSIPPNSQDTFRYERWLQSGLHSGMAYLASEYHLRARKDPRVLFPEVQSILVLSIPYPSPQSRPKPQNGLPHGRIAAYAWTKDYHLAAPAIFKQVVADLEKDLAMEIHWRGYTDSAPILERQMGMQAGLGWIGRNGCLIHPLHGSYFLLGEIFTDVTPDELAQSSLISRQEQIPDRCGTCTRCIDACPAGCILPDRTIDAGRCISYLTIENKGVIPRGLRSRMGDWVFGCDICQTVCPWNRKASTLSADVPQIGIDPYPDLLQQLLLTESDFKTLYHDSPVLRPKRQGWLRNVCVALGNAGDPDAVEPLIEVLRSEPEPMIRVHAAWALGRMGTRTALAALEQAANADPDELVREECLLSREQA